MSARPMLRRTIVSLALPGLALACGDAAVGSPTPQGTDAGGSAPALDAGAKDASGGDAALAADGAPTACDVTAKAGLQHATCAGIALTISAPAACVSTPCGLILDVHGLAMDADSEDANDGLRALGNAAGFVVVQPTAPQTTAYGNTWFSSDDAALWAAFMATAKAFSSDARKLHVTGFSQGGYVAWRMLCAHADQLASVAPGAAGKASCPAGNFNETCTFVGADRPSRAIDVLFVAGNKDAIVPATCTSAQVSAVVAAWGGQKQTVASDGTYARDRYVGSAGNVFEVLTHDYTTDPAGPLAANKGHCMPGAAAHTGSVWDALGCKAPNAFAWGKEVVAFFQAHPAK